MSSIGGRYIGIPCGGEKMPMFAKKENDIDDARAEAYRKYGGEIVIKLSDCPICKNKAEIGYAFGDYFVHCSDKCPSPGCFHAGDTITACSWNDWAEWIARYMPIIDEARAAKAMEDSQ